MPNLLCLFFDMSEVHNGKAYRESGDNNILS